MLTVHRILCAVDFSPSSARALDHALVFTRWFRSGLHVLYVQHGTLLPPEGPAGRRASTFQVWDYLPRLQAKLTRFAEPALRTSSPALPVELEVKEGEVVEEILERSLTLPADLLVLGTHGHGPLHDLTLGSVAEKVLRRATCPVLAVPPAVEEEAGPLLFGTIVCAVDFSEPSRSALRYALALAREADAHLIVAHVCEDLPADESLAASRHPGREFQAGKRAEALERLRGFHALEKRDAAVPREDVVLAGKAWRGLSRLCRERGARLAVVGVHGEVPLGERIFGSTAHHLVREGACPVLAIRPRSPGPL